MARGIRFSATAGRSTTTTRLIRFVFVRCGLFKKGAQDAERSDYDHAIADYTEALSLYPDWYEAKENLEIARRRRGY
ncbi:hypothetical protein FACS1894137_02350 [Spirochaetia bacterium]|nr:hypothetical protein FACS1894137_02350 [Spirochaetia bacterium]